MTDDELLKLLAWALRYWQGAYRMEDWEFQLRFVPKRELSREDRIAEVVRDAPRREAVVRLLQPGDLDASCEFEVDYRRVLAHEFAHTITWPFVWPAENTVEEKMCEQAIETLAAGLVNMTPWERMQP